MPRVPGRGDHALSVRASAQNFETRGEQKSAGHERRHDGHRHQEQHRHDDQLGGHRSSRAEEDANAGRGGVTEDEGGREQRIELALGTPEQRHGACDDDEDGRDDHLDPQLPVGESPSSVGPGAAQQALDG